MFLSEKILQIGQNLSKFWSISKNSHDCCKMTNTKTVQKWAKFGTKPLYNDFLLSKAVIRRKLFFMKFLTYEVKKITLCSNFCLVKVRILLHKSKIFS